MNDFPSVWCLVCVPSLSVEYTSTNMLSVKSFFNCLPEEVRDLFEVVEYRANNNNNNNER